MSSATRARSVHRGLTTTCAALAAALALSAPRAATAQGDDEALLLDLRDDVSAAEAAALAAQYGLARLRLNSVHAEDERFFVGAPAPADATPSATEALLARLAQDPRVEHAERNLRLQASGLVPDDPRYAEQWGLRKVGAERAWAVTRGRGVVVAVIDTGVRTRLEDLAGVATTPGYDFVNDDEDPDDDHGHGSHVAGTIAQRTNNGRGVAGLAFEATLMPLKVLDARGSGTTADIADAIRFAADEGAQVLNLSLGGGARSETLAAAVAYARRKGVLVVAAAGNGGRRGVELPAAYPGAIAVGAVGPDGRRAPYSSFGPELALAAPGGDTRQAGGGIVQNTLDPSHPDALDHYAAFQGTSMATPHVAAALALVLAAGVTDPDAALALLREHARGASGAGDEALGAGVIDVGAALGDAADERGDPRAFALALALAALVARRRGALGAPGLVALLLTSSGLWFLPALGLGGAWATAIPAWDRLVLGVDLAGSALWLLGSPLGVVVLFGVRRDARWVVGLALGWAAFLLMASVRDRADVLGIPGTSGLLDHALRALVALVLVVLARLVSLGRESR
jgi:serine protease